MKFQRNQTWRVRKAASHQKSQEASFVFSSDLGRDDRRRKRRRGRRRAPERTKRNLITDRAYTHRLPQSINIDRSLSRSVNFFEEIGPGDYGKQPATRSGEKPTSPSPPTLDCMDWRRKSEEGVDLNGHGWTKRSFHWLNWWPFTFRVRSMRSKTERHDKQRAKGAVWLALGGVGGHLKPS